MVIRAVKYSFLLALAASLISGCAIEAERIQIEVQDDLSSTVHLILLQQAKSYENQLELYNIDNYMGLPDLDRAQIAVSDCGFSTKAYRVNNDSKGFTAQAKFETKGDLEFSLSCISTLGEVIRLSPLTKTEGPFGASYELQIEVTRPKLASEAIHELRVTLPGSMELVQPNFPAWFAVTSKIEGSDTVVWRISPPQPSDQATTTSKHIVEPVSAFLTARSYKSSIRPEWVISTLGVLFGSGALWQVFRSRRKSDTKSAEKAVQPVAGVDRVDSQ